LSIDARNRTRCFALQSAFDCCGNVTVSIREHRMTNGRPTRPTMSVVTRVRVRSSLEALVMLCIGASALEAQSGQGNPRNLDSLAGAPVHANQTRRGILMRRWRSSS
jgi:hypothetical protein